jgi:hypothetical protein
MRGLLFLVLPKRSGTPIHAVIIGSTALFLGNFSKNTPVRHCN